MQEDAKLLRKRNIKVFTDILDNMPSLTYCTTWSETQQMLLDNPQFTEDPDLQSKCVLESLLQNILTVSLCQIDFVVIELSK